MKAAVYNINGEPDVFELIDVPDPAPALGEVLIRTEAISVEGGDLIFRRRIPPKHKPHIVGYASAGEIVALGAGVSQFSVGQKVTTFGAHGSYAEFRTVRAEHCWVVPAGMDCKTAACVPVAFGTAYQALFDLGGLQSSQTVLIQGAAGGVGMAAVQLAKQAGARVIGTFSNPMQIEFLQSLGLDEAINYGSENVLARVRELTQKKGVHVVVDSIGGASLQTAIDCLGEGGRAVMVGLVDAAPQQINAASILYGRKHLLGCMLGATMHQPEVRAFIDALLHRVASGDLVQPIAAVFNLSEAAEAHCLAETRGRPLGRIVLIPDPLSNRHMANG
jgi:NADPH2:quinone reductase